MRTIKGLALGMALMLALALSASAQTQCAPPGDVPTPPCVAAHIVPEDSGASGETITSTSSPEDVLTISETTLGVLLSALSVF